MPERHENDYENMSGQWEEMDEGGRVTYRERRAPRQGAPRDCEDSWQSSRPQAARGSHAAVPPRRPSGNRRTYRADSPHVEGRGARARVPYATAPASADGAAAAQGSFLEPVLLLVVALLSVHSFRLRIFSFCLFTVHCINLYFMINTEIQLGRYKIIHIGMY